LTGKPNSSGSVLITSRTALAWIIPSSHARGGTTGSIISFSLAIPAASTCSNNSRATSHLDGTSLGTMLSEYKRKPTISASYSFARGKILSSFRGSREKPLMTALLFAALSPSSMAAGFEVSRTMGRLVTLSTASIKKVIYIMFLVWNVDLTAWVASAGIIGLAVSFAAKDTLANLFSGVFIMADSPYQLGDFIVLDSGERGAVTNIGIRSTRLLTRDDVEITVPNSIMGNTKVTNEAGGRHEKYRIRVQVGVAYGSPIDKVHDILLDVATSCSDVCKIPEPRIRFRAFGNSSLDHELLCWVETPVLRGKVLHMLNTEVYKRFEKEGIEIPFPQRDVHIRSTVADDKNSDSM